ncbi:MAG TPA: TonB-dependent receptor, partial [Polyangia bacterium]
QRGGATVDMDLNLKYGFRVLFGGEAFYEGISGSVDSFSQQPYGVVPAGVPSTASPSALPVICPQMQNADGTFTPVPKCPRQFINDAYRVVGAVYADLQYRPLSKLTLDGGVRIQEGFGGRPYDLIPLYSAAAVWNFLPDFHLKATYTTGFRPPVYQATDAAPGGVNYGANTALQSETSQSFQGEVNARLLRNTRKVRELELRVDYSYTFLDKLIQIHGGSYANTGQRAIHSVEGYAKLYLNGDHFLQASYTYLYSVASDIGVVRNMPNNWISLGGSFNIIKHTLDLNANLLVTSAYQDPNRVPTEGSPGFGSTTGARTSDLTFDRLTPVALLQLGFRLRFLQEKLGVTGQFYNVLNQRYYSPDGFNDITPSVELTPTPMPGFSFFASVSYHP